MCNLTVPLHSKRTPSYFLSLKGILIDSKKLNYLTEYAMSSAPEANWNTLNVLKEKKVTSPKFTSYLDFFML